MRNSIRLSLAAVFAASLLAASMPPDSQAFDATQAKCRATVVKSGGKYSKTVLKTLTGCHKSRDKDGSLSGTNCNDIGEADFKSQIPTAVSQFSSGLAKTCVGVTPSAVLYDACPAPCNAAVPVISTFDHVAACLTCLTDNNSEAYSDDVNGTPASPLTDEAKCHGAITKNGAKLVGAVIKAIGKCQATAEKGGAESLTACTVTDFADLTQKAYDKAFDGITKSCAAITLPSGTLDACGGALTVFDLAACVADAARVSGQELVDQYLELEAAVVTTTTTTTTTMGAGHPQCPNVGELELFSHLSNTICTTNGDCAAPRTCDTSLGICTTVADLDSGWTGVAHNSDINDQVKTRARLSCPGPAPTCGQCNVAGIDPTPGNCRCANNLRTYCDQPFVTDPDCKICVGGTTPGITCSINGDCVGGGSCGAPSACECYFGTPFPLNSAGTHVCLVNRFAQDITGTANVDAGSGAITAILRTRVYAGIVDNQPCPVCGGKCSDTMVACLRNSDCGSNNCMQDTPGDLVRDGLCVGGASPGATCDVNGTNASFPAVYNAGAGSGGGGYSLDCQPTSGSNISGQGLLIKLAQNTGTSSLPFTLDCDGAGPGTDVCPCLECSGASGTPCANDGDCSANPGACAVPRITGAFNCAINTDCNSVNMGSCNPGSLKCTLAPSYTCATNADCTNQNIGPCSPATCTSKGNNFAGFPIPNQCDGGGCTNIGGEEGECTTGPDEMFCDGLVRADGTGMKVCSSNADCAASGGGGGLCSQVVRRKCFLDPIVANGSPDPAFPVAGATFCVPGTNNPGVNSAAGLPGPARVVSQGAAKTFCALDNNVQYQPGIGGCP